MPSALEREVKVRPRADSSIAAIGDHLLLYHARSHADAGPEARQVQIAGLQPIEVAKAHVLTRCAVIARASDRSIAYCPNRGAHWGAVIDAVVLFYIIEHRVEAVAEPRGDVGVLERAFEKRLSGRRPVLHEV